MSRSEVLLLVAVAGALTFALRASFLVAGSRLRLGGSLRTALEYVPAAVLAALVTPALFAPGPVRFGPLDARLLAGAVAAVVAWRTKNVLLTFVVGMLALWGITWLAG